MPHGAAIARWRKEGGKAEQRRELSWPSARTDSYCREIVRRPPSGGTSGRSGGKSYDLLLLLLLLLLCCALSRENGCVGERRGAGTGPAADETSGGSFELPATPAAAAVPSVVRVLGIAAQFARCAYAWHVRPDFLATFQSLAMMKCLSDSRLYAAFVERLIVHLDLTRAITVRISPFDTT